MTSNNEPLLLTDEQMVTFIKEGVLLLKADFPKAFQERLLAQLNEVYSDEGNPGNNILPRIRDLQKVFDHPVITGALTSVLGPNYLLHTHRHGHYNASSVPGGWHKDSYWGYGRLRNHHPWWAMIMYFPQDTPIELGPTGIFPGTQYYETRTFNEENPDGEVTASGEAGTFALIHYDIWHRSTANLLGKPRYMLKFEFMRTLAPTEPTWNNKISSWPPIVGGERAGTSHEILWEENWNWLSGRMGSLVNTKPGDAVVIDKLTLQLQNEEEAESLNAAYELASRGESGTAALLKSLLHDDVRVSRKAAYGLAVAGSEAIPGLITVLDDERDATVSHAAFALGELRGLAENTVPKMVKVLGNRNAKVRSTIVEAIGLIGQPVAETVSALVSGLQDEDDQVRFTSALSLLRMGSAAADAVPALAEALDDVNRYVRGHASQALRAINTEAAREILFKELFNVRWCSDTTKASTF